MKAFSILFVFLALFSDGQSYIIRKDGSLTIAVANRQDLKTISDSNSSVVIQLGGRLLPTSDGIGITNTIGSNGNRFRDILIEGHTGFTPIIDQQQWQYPNYYEVNLPAPSALKIKITDSKTKVNISKSDGTYITSLPIPKLIK